MTMPTEVERLVGRFREQHAAYRQAGYNETQLRREFVDPFFEALGWDLSNRQGLSDAYKEVVHEDRLIVGGASRAPDYSFRVGGQRKFFVESKKPAVNLYDAPSPAFQLRRYAWSAKLPLSVLTDFEEFVVYDCREEPSKEDAAATARLLYVGFEEYAGRWDEIRDLFSRDAVLAGSFEAYAESLRVKRGTSEVDNAFLRDIERWRNDLAEDFAARNPALTQRELNFAVQQTIDRVVFLRIAEDRGLEPYGQLQTLANTSGVYQRLKELFVRADDRYNSGLFHFRNEDGRDEPPDQLTPALQAGDEPLNRIVGRLYYPDSPYEFSVLPARILGHVYEQFLGRVIRLTTDHVAVVEDKPEVKKAGGVYYTPNPIVDFIVDATLAALLAGKTPAQVGGEGRNTSPMRVLDPACGSGSFLLGAFEYLLRWYLDSYLSEPTRWMRGRTPRIRQVSDTEWRLTSGERKRILLTHIYGVDIDTQAVEVTKLSLLLKVLALIHRCSVGSRPGGRFE
jgi:N-6 DNA Methylase